MHFGPGLKTIKIVAYWASNWKSASAGTVQMGADLIVDPSRNSAAKDLKTAAQTDDSRGIAAILDFVGLPQTMEFGLSLLRKGGHHVHVGLLSGAYSMSLPPLAFRMLRVSGSYVVTLSPNGLK